MIDSDQRPDSNRRPLLKSASTDVIISNHGYSQIGVLSKFSDLWPIYWLGLYVGEFIGRRFEKVKKDEVCDVDIGHGFEEWTSIRGWTWI